MPSVMGVQYHNRRGPTGLTKATVIQKFGSHTIGFLDYKFTDKRQFLLPPENTPVSVLFGAGPTNVRTFYGYVNHYETVTDEYERALTRAVLVGTSKVMNTARPFSWLETTYSSVARDIASKQKFRSVIHNHPYVMDNWTTGTRTDFQALKDIASATGYRLWVDGSTVFLLDPRKAIASASEMTLPRIPNRNVRSSQVMVGSNIPGEFAAPVRTIQYGLDYRTNEFFTSTSGPTTLPTTVSNTTPNTFSDAETLSDAEDRKQRDSYVIKAEIEGVARLHPGSPIRFDSGTVDTDRAGVWLVSEAEHVVTRREFVTSLVATRGSTPQPLQSISSPIRGSGTVSAVVRDGNVWEAALQEHIHA